MKRKLIEYFNSLKDKDLPKCQGKFADDGVKIREIKNDKYYMSWLKPYKFGDDIMCMKEYEEKNWTKKEIMEVISGDYFNSLKIPSVVCYPTLMTVASSYFDHSVPGHGLASHYLHAIPGMEFMDGSSVKRFVKAEILDEARLNGEFPPNISQVEDNWWLLEDNFLRRKLLEVMTPECFDDFISLFIADKMGTYTDRHGENFFFYRRTGGHKWEGVVAIDNERVTTLLGVGAGEEFERILNERKYATRTPQWSGNYSTHGDNMREIREYLEKGKFNSRHEEVIKGALEYPYADNMKKTCEDYQIRVPNFLYDDVARLWEFNRETLKDL